MSKRLYLGLCILFITVFFMGMNLLQRSYTYDLTLMSYYSGGHNTALNYFEENTGYSTEFIGVAKDNYATKVDSVLESDEIPDIIMVPSSDLGRYLDTGLFYDFNEIFKGDANYQYFVDNATKYGLKLGQKDGKQLAIKLENTSSVFVYDKLLASTCLNINDEEEFNDYFIDYTSLIKAQDNLEDECPATYLLATQEYTNFFSDQNNIINNKKLNEDIVTYITYNKEIVNQVVYSKYGEYSQLIEDANEGSFIGDITTVNNLGEIYNLGNENYVIGQSPIYYQGEAPYFLISKDADLEKVIAFFDMTLFNQTWLINNINELGVLENTDVMQKSNLNNPNLEQYFNNDNLYSDIDTYSDITINGDIFTSPYDYGIRNILSGVISEYNNGKIKKEDIKSRLLSDFKVFYPQFEGF